MDAARTAPAPTKEDVSLFRLGGWAGILGGIIAILANILHPRPIPADLGDTEKFLELVGGYELWRLDHLAILVAVFLGIIGIVAVGRSLVPASAAGLGRAAVAMGIASAAVALAFFALDGLVWSTIASDFLSATDAASRSRVLERAEVTQLLDIALFTLTIFGLFGVNQILFGLAIARSGNYPHWIGWIAILGGILGLASGTWIWTTGEFGVGNLLILFTAASVLFTVWTIAASFQLVRIANSTGKPPS